MCQVEAALCGSRDMTLQLPASGPCSTSWPVISDSCSDVKLRSAAVYPDKGTVCFSAGLHGWAFTLTVFAKLYAKKVDSCCAMLRILLTPRRSPCNAVFSCPSCSRFCQHGC